MNCYTTLDNMKARLGISGTSEDARVFTVIEAASRMVDQMAGRFFHTETGTRYFDGTKRDRLVVPDLQSVSELATDPDRDESYSDTWTEGTHFVLMPTHASPKMHIREKLGSHDFRLNGGGLNWIRITGVWGAGNMRDTNPWIAIDDTASTDDDTTTTLTLGDGSAVQAGMTLRVGSEQIFVEAIDGTTATVIRGVNGTTAATHSGVAVYTAEYPATVVNGAEIYGVHLYREVTRLGLQSESIGDYSYSMSNAFHTDAHYRRVVNRVRREPWF